MGCDSHPYLEIKGRNGRWGLHDDYGRYYKLRGAAYKDLEDLRPNYLNVLGRRNYRLFAVLADVRNGGWGQEKYITPLFAQRSLPKDVSKAVLKKIPTGGDYHSHTWFTARELLDVDWDAVAGTSFEVVVYAADYMAWKETGLAPHGCPDYPENMDDLTREVSHEEMVMLLMSNTAEFLTQMLPCMFERGAGKGRKKKPTLVRSGPFVRVETPRTYRQVVPDLIASLPDLEKLGDPDKVRIVIAFDN